MVESITSQNLNARWSEIQAQQGWIGKAWNGIKETFDVGQSASDCEKMLEKYKKHEISLEEAMEYIESFEKKQTDMTNLIANIATGVGAIALATVSGGSSIVGLQALKYGAPIGAAIKTGLKTLDRATNGVEGDALDAKELVKDAVSGAVTGTTSAVSSHIFAGVKAAKLSTSVINGAKCGLACGALSGASNYLTDTALEEDKKFDFGELTKNTAVSAVVSGTIGALVGGSVFGCEKLFDNLGNAYVLASEATGAENEVVMSTGAMVARDGFLSSTRKVGGTELKAGLNAVKHAFAA